MANALWDACDKLRNRRNLMQWTMQKISEDRKSTRHITGWDFSSVVLGAARHWLLPRIGSWNAGGEVNQEGEYPDPQQGVLKPRKHLSMKWTSEDGVAWLLVQGVYPQIPLDLTERIIWIWTAISFFQVDIISGTQIDGKGRTYVHPSSFRVGRIIQIHTKLSEFLLGTIQENQVGICHIHTNIYIYNHIYIKNHQNMSHSNWIKLIDFPKPWLVEPRDTRGPTPGATPAGWSRGLQGQFHGLPLGHLSHSYWKWPIYNR